MRLINKKNFLYLLLYFIIFGVFFPSIRVLLIGNKGATSSLQYFIAALPEFITFILIIYSLLLFLKEKGEIKLNLLDKAVLFFIIFNVIFGTYLAHNLKISLYGFRLSYLPVLFYFLIRSIPFNKKILLALVNKIFVFFALIGLLGIIIYFFFFDFMVVMIHKTGSGVFEYFIPRMTSIFWTPVVFGTFMSTTFCYFYFKIFQKNSNYRHYIYLSIASFCVLFSLSRGSIFIMILTLILIPLLFSQWKKITLPLSIIIIQFLALGYYINSPKTLEVWMLKSYKETADLKHGITRVELWKNAYVNFKEKPQGYGLGKAGHVATRFYGKESNSAAVSSTDGWFIKIVNETGLLGLGSYLFLSIIFLVNSWKNFKNKGTPIVGFMLIVFIIINVQNIVSNVLDFYLFSNVFWLLLGITENIKNEKQ